MVVKGLPPGVEDGGDADVRAEVLWIGSDGQQRLRRGLEEQGIDRRLVLVGDGADRRRQGEDDVVVGDRQQLGLPGGHPSGRRPPLALRAMAVAARVVGDTGMGAVLAALDMTTERGGTTGFDRRHGAQLAGTHMAGIRRTPSLAVAAEDIRHLQPPTGHGRAQSERGSIVSRSRGL